MRHAVITVLLLAACGEPRQLHRWPDHRREKDALIEVLQQRTATLTTRATDLEERVHKLEAALAKLQPAPPAVTSVGP
jgi:hypothetical protein